jgi:hypothetical protein
MSSVERGTPQDLCEVEPHELWTKDVPASWSSLLTPRYQIDLKNRYVVPTAYTLRHGMSTKADFIRAWDLQGSKDGMNWDLINRHRQDEALEEGFGSHTWQLPPVKTSYKIFRVLQTGKNSSNHNFLCLSGSLPPTPRFRALRTGLRACPRSKTSLGYILGSSSDCPSYTSLAPVL